ncbi:MAG: OmpH family outer membrane protein [Candidatus Auribacterota bacterium]
MKSLKTLATIAFVGSCLCSFNASAQQSSSLKIGFVNFDEVVRRYYKTVIYQEQMQSEAAGEEADLKEKIEEINRIKEEMQLLSEEARQEKEKLLQLKIAEAQGQRDQTKRDFQRKAINSMTDVFNDIYVEIDKQGKEGGYTFIFRQKFSSPAIDQPLVLYGDAQYDLTESVITALNANKPADVELPTDTKPEPVQDNDNMDAEMPEGM